MRKGDFGEILASWLYGERLGRQIPFKKLQPKPVGDATVQGPDLLGLTLGYGENPEPVICEVKLRTIVKPKELLAGIAGSLDHATNEYLESAWASGVALMEAHPDHARSYALSAAQHLARLIDPDGDYPDHRRHCVVVTTKDNLPRSKIEEHWRSTPPVSEFHVVVVEDLEAVVAEIYDAAAVLTYGDVAGGVPHLLGAGSYVPGLSAPVGLAAPASIAAAHGSSENLALIEAALWHLADWDGMGTARARRLIETSTDCRTTGLARILTGAIGAASKEVAETVLAPFAEAVKGAWKLRLTGDELTEVTNRIADACADPELGKAVRHVGAAVVHRLPRHPRTLVTAAGAAGPHVRHVVDQMEHFGRHALWPSQSAALVGGLLDRGQPSLAIRMPTSSGKTALVELLVADALDQDDQAVVAVLAPTRALVGQLTADLRKALPGAAGVRSSHGGLDFDTDDPSAGGILGEHGVAVLTPERFDLEWRRAVTGDQQASIDKLRLLIVDEAHLIYDRGRGARLELNVARALRSGMRVVLLSSQFPEPAQLAGWLEGRPIESDWTPAWLRRFVYYRSDDEDAGLLRAENGQPEQVLELKPSKRSKGDGCPRDRKAEAAALAHRLHAEGLVVIFANEKLRIHKLVDEVRERFGDWSGAPTGLVRLAEAVDATDCGAADLLRNGIGLHHADVPRVGRQAIDTAGRNAWLRCLVCTPTLLEGVDFPTRTVIAAYPPQVHGKPQIAKLRNLEGRAGRGGKFTSGTLVVMSNDAARAKKWLAAFRNQLPPTRSALALALDELRRHASEIGVLDVAVDEAWMVDAIDGLVLSAVADGATIDGEWRMVLEEALGRTLWYSTTVEGKRSYLLDLAGRRASYVARAVGDSQWSQAYYRTGLPVASCAAIRDAVAPRAGEFRMAMTDGLARDADDWLVWLATVAAPNAKLLEDWQAFDQAELAKAVEMWLRGDPVDDITSRHADAWKAIESDLESLVPWVVTGAVEITAAAVGEPGLRDVAHRRLAVSRLRYGVPRAELCDLVRQGRDRVAVTRLAATYDEEPPITKLFLPLPEYVDSRLPAMGNQAGGDGANTDEV